MKIFFDALALVLLVMILPLPCHAQTDERVAQSLCRSAVIIDAKINGAATTVLIDTGAEVEVIAPDVVQRVTPITAWGEVWQIARSPLVQATFQLEVLNRRYPFEQALASPLFGVSGCPTVPQIILGRNFLSEFGLSVSDSRAIKIESAGFLRGNINALNLELDSRGAPIVRYSIGDQEGWAIIDTGYNGGLIVKRASSGVAPDFGWKFVKAGSVRTINGVRRVEKYHVPSVSIGGRPLHGDIVSLVEDSGWILSPDERVNGLIGTDILLTKGFSIDLHSKRILIGRQD